MNKTKMMNTEDLKEWEERSQYMRPDGTYLTKEEAAKEIILPYTKEELEALSTEDGIKISLEQIERGEYTIVR